MIESLDLAARLEALLFSEGGGPMQKKKLAQLLDCKESELADAIHTLSDRRKDSGIALIEADLEIALAIAPSATETIRIAHEREIGREIGDAGLEVLAIILYRGPSTRTQIDYIRGVNTSSTIRTLTARGLIERIVNPEDAREYLYRPTTELLAHLGATEARNLPDHAKIASELAAFEASKGPFNEDADGVSEPE
ncbi:SMC-Scp complex subunit ScpB [Candidatus Kaiserbacteria bacterium]|nr:SMC-Scp complex subunit ScpB [Candidatus Kaiserbacteria bacterium]